MAVTAAQLSEQLQKAGLISGDHVQACCDSAGADLQSIAPEKLAKQLVKDGRLTLFQAQLAVNGKTSSLVIGSYVVLEKLGQGGMGQVYKARHQTMKREVALKVISPAVVKNEASLKRFQREVEAAARLSHPNIVTAHDAGESRGTHYLVMEYIKGQDLSAVVKATGPLKITRAVECVLQTAQGLAYAHGRGIVHRDIKPANLLQDESGTIKILDMGLARFDETGIDHAAAAGLTGTGVLMGTVDYMSPEQAMDSKTADAKSDIYSLGCTLYFLMTGRPIYEDDTIVKRLMAHQSAAIPRLPSSDPALQSILERMVAKKADQRFATTDLLVAELQQWLGKHRNSATIQTTGEMTLVPISDPSEFPKPSLQNAASQVESPGLRPLGTSPAAPVSVLPVPSVQAADTSPSVSAAAKTLNPERKPSAGAKTDIAQPTSAAVEDNVTIETPVESVLPSRRRSTKLSNRTQPARAAAGKASGKTPWLLYGGLGGGAALLIALAVIFFRVQTPIGTIVIETDQADIAGAVVTIDEQQMITLVAGDDQQPIEIRADEREHTLRVRKGGFSTLTQKFTLKAGESQTITVRLEPAADIAAKSRAADDPVKAAASTTSAMSPTPAAGVPPTTSPVVSEQDLPPIDYAAERKAAEWLAKIIKGGYVNLRKEDFGGVHISAAQRVVPTENFVVEEIVVIEDCGIDDEGMTNLSGCRRLQGFNLSYNKISCTGLSHLKDVRTLRSLLLRACFLDDEIWPLLAHWPKLEVLELQHSTLTDGRIAEMPELPELNELAVGETLVTDVGLQTLASRCRNVSELSIRQDDGTHLRTLSSIKYFPKLTTVWCSTSQVTNDGIAAVQRHPSMTELLIGGRPSDATYQGLIPVQDKLTALMIHGTALSETPPTSNAFVFLAQQRALERLTIHAIQGSPHDADLQIIATLPRLKSLTLQFGETSKWPDFPEARRQYTIAGIEAFRKVRPDVTVTADGVNYPATAEPGSVTIPTPPPVPIPVAEVPKPEIARADPSLSGTLAPNELRMAEGSGNRTPFTEQLRPGDPLGEFAAVSRPAKVEGVLSWSIEPLVHRGGIEVSAVSSQGVIATGGLDCVIRLWTTDWQLIKVLPGHANAVHSVEFSPDGQRLVSAANSPRSMVAMWDVGSGQLLWSVPAGMWNGRVSWAPDGSRVAVCEADRLWLLDSNTGIPRGELKRPRYLQDAAWTSDSRRICLVNEGEANVLIVDAATMVVSQEFQHKSKDRSAAWSADGHWLAVNAETGTTIYDANTFASRQTLPSNGHAVAFSPDSTQLAVAGDGVTTVYKTTDWSQQWQQPFDSRSLSWSNDGAWLISRTLRRDAQTGKLIDSAPQALPRTLSVPALDGSKVATLSDNALRIWNADDGSLIRESPEPRHDNRQLLWNAQGTRLLRLGRIETNQQVGVEVIDPDSGSTVHVLQGHVGQIWRVCWSPSGQLAASVGEDGACIVWDTSTGQQVRMMKHAEPQWWVQWSADDRMIACGAQTIVTVWDAASGEQKRAFRTLTQRFSATNGIWTGAAPFCFMKDSTQMTVLGKGNTMDLLNVTTGQISSLGDAGSPGNGGSRFTIAWSPDFKTLGSPTSYREFEAFQQGTAEGKAARFFVQPNWLGDSRRVLGGDNESGFVTGLDVKTMRRLGTLFPELPHGDYAALSPDGHYNGSPGIAEQLVVLGLQRNGSLKTYSLSEFAETFGWKNDPAKVRFLKTGR